jgi:hypothetical protein
MDYAPPPGQLRSGTDTDRGAEEPMSTILIIVLVFLLLGGGGFYGRGRWW